MLIKGIKEEEIADILDVDMKFINKVKAHMN